MGKKGKAAAVEAPTTMPNPPLWNGLSNALPAVDEENPLPSPGASTGNWKEDYVAYCAVLGIKPHPRLVATRVYVPEGDAGDEGKGGAGDADDGKDGAGEEKEQVRILRRCCMSVMSARNLARERSCMGYAKPCQSVAARQCPCLCYTCAVIVQCLCSASVSTVAV